MHDHKGGIKTSIFLFAVLMLITLFLFLFIQNFYVKNKQIATIGLNDMNTCIDITFDTFNPLYENNTITFYLKNNVQSKIINKISLVFNNSISKSQNISLEPNTNILITFKNISYNNFFEVYPNNCKKFSKKIMIKE